MADSAFDLSGKRILVTGAASGIARAFALMAGRDGAALGLLDIDRPGLDAVSAEVGASSNTVSVGVDLSDWDETAKAVEQVVAGLGGLDVVCNVAGWDAPGRFWDQPLEHWQKLLAVNLWAPLYVCRATVPLMVDQEAGCIVNVSSDAGRVGSKGETVYAAAKGGVMALTKSLAREVAPHGVTVNCLCPGPTRTPLLEEEIRNNPKLMEKMIRAVPLRRAAEPEDQAWAIAYLASDAAAYMTGQVLSVSGGLTMVG